MKRETYTHVKTKRLARSLGIPLPHAIGLLALLWDTTGDRAPRGDIGKLADADIAEYLDWSGDPAKLIAALVENKWLDVVPLPERLLVHDWPEHCFQTTDRHLARTMQRFACGCLPRPTNCTTAERANIAKLQAQVYPTCSLHNPTRSVHVGSSPTPAPSPALPLPLPKDADKSKTPLPPPAGDCAPAPPASPPPAETPKAKRTTKPAPTITYPPALDTTAFRAAWTRHQQYRQEQHFKPLGAIATESALAKLAEMGEARALAAIAHSEAKGWQGIFEPDAPSLFPGGNGKRPINHLETPGGPKGSDGKPLTMDNW